MFHLIQAAHTEIAALRAEFATIASRIKAGERVAVQRIEAIEHRIEQAFHHVTVAHDAAHPANTPEAGMAAAPKEAPDAGAAASTTTEPQPTTGASTATEQQPTAGAADAPNTAS